MNTYKSTPDPANGGPRTNFDIQKERVIPTAPEAEKSVLGCVLLDKDSFLRITDLLVPEDFYYDHNKYIVEAMLDLFHKSKPVDIVTVATNLQASGKLETVGGPEYLTDLQAGVPIATHIFQYHALLPLL